MDQKYLLQGRFYIQQLLETFNIVVSSFPSHVML